MVQSVSFQGSYSQRSDYGTSLVVRYVIATQHGLVHYKIARGRTKTFIFTDLEARPLEGWFRQNTAARIESLKKHRQWNRARADCTKAGGTFGGTPWGTTEDIWEQYLSRQPAITTDTKAMEAWKTVTGGSLVPRYEDIIEDAELMVANERNSYLAKKAVAMAQVDEMWGIF